MYIGTIAQIPKYPLLSPARERKNTAVDGSDMAHGYTSVKHAGSQAEQNDDRIGRGFGKICSIEETDQVITDDGITDNYAKWLENNGVTPTIV